MSKKLIAVASATALALSALVGITPAYASVTATLTGTSGAASPGTAAVPVIQTVPATNSLAGTGSADVLFASILADDVVTVTTSGGVKLTRAETAGSADVNVTTLGSQSISVTATTTTLRVFAYTTNLTTTEIKWTVTRTGASFAGSLFIQGDAGTVYNLTNVVAPASLAAGATSVVTFNANDQFGNLIKTATLTSVVTGDNNSVVDATWDAALGKHKFTHTGKTGPYVLGIDLGATSVAGLPAKADEAFLVVNNPAAVTANAAAVAQIAALTAQLANSRGKDVSVTMKKFNALAKRWNSAFPGQKVALKK